MRSYPLPRRLASIEGGVLLSSVVAAGSATSLDLERIARAYPDGVAGEWAESVLQREVQTILDKLLKDNGLPEAILMEGSEDIVVGLATEADWFDGEWHGEPCGCDSVPIDESTVAFVASALTEGLDGVVLRAAVPLGFISAAEANQGAADVPEGSIVIAVVDDLDRDAVLDLVAIAPGPVAYRRHDGAWHEDPEWLKTLRGVSPPPVVELNPETAATVIAQVDESTQGKPFSDDRKQNPIAASISRMEWLARHERAADQATAARVITAASKAAASVEGHALGAEKLRQYWSTGEGALKIRWGTPGSWTRCYKQLFKYMGPRSAGYCTRLCQRVGGFGVACHVGTKAKKAVKRAVAP